jgi:molecular chaperone DnaJ
MQLAKKFHPDTNKEKNAQEKFVQISEAYEVRSALHSQHQALLNALKS